MALLNKKKQYIDYEHNLKGLRMTREYDRMKERNQFYTNELKELEIKDTEQRKRFEELSLRKPKELSKLEYNEFVKLGKAKLANYNYQFFLRRKIKNTS
jgi:hypothetical protein